MFTGLSPSFESLEPRLLLSSVTLVTHGYNGNTQGWVSAVADAIAERTDDPDGTSILTMNVTDANGPAVSSVLLDRGPNPFAATDSGDLIIKLEWGSISGGSYSTTAVANAVADHLLNTTINNVALIDAPIHMIGHSRGASLIAVLAENLGHRGVWVDHLTFLDPHPVNSGGGDDPLDFGDPSMQITENVVFADDYFRQDGFLEFVDFDGEPVNGAFNLELDEDTLGGFFNDPGYTLEHSDTHLWYFGTINLNSNANNGDESVPTNWYNGSQGPRNSLGFAFSSIAGVTQPNAGLAIAHGGVASRIAVNPIAEQWPNVRKLEANLDGSVERGDSLPISFSYQDQDTAADVRVYLDINGDPNDGNELLIDTISLGSTGEAVMNWSGEVDTSSAIPGNYRIFAQIDDGQHHRHHYANGSVTVVDTIAPTILQSQINNNDEQRSLLTSLKVNFSEQVQITNAFDLQNLDTGDQLDSQMYEWVYDDQTQSIAISFPELNGASLPDGNYRATIRANNVTDVGSNVLQDGIDWTMDFFRYFGDHDGDRDVDAADLFEFRSSYSSNKSDPRFDTRFDWDADGDVDAADLFRFRANFSTRLDEPVSAQAFVANPENEPSQWAAIYWAYEMANVERSANEVVPIDELLGLT